MENFYADEQVGAEAMEDKDKDRLQEDIEHLEQLLADIELELQSRGSNSGDEIARLRELQQVCKIELYLLKKR